MLEVFTVLVMLGVAAALAFEGLFTALCMFVNVILAGLITFNFYEPLADFLEENLAGTQALGHEDAICLVFLFWIVLGVLRVVTNLLAPAEIDFDALIHRGGGAFFGLLTGYLVAGFLVTVFQTLPLHENFLGFEPKIEAKQGLRHYLPPDRVWLALMHRAGTASFSSEKDHTFDRAGNYALRYTRHRRHNDQRGPMPYSGEFDQPTTPPAKAGLSRE
jgi:hypothetical protein